MSEDEEWQIKKQLFQVLIDLYPGKLTNSALYQRIRHHHNNSSQCGYSARLKMENFINLFLDGVMCASGAMCGSFFNDLVSVDRLMEFTHTTGWRWNFLSC